MQVAIATLGLLLLVLSELLPEGASFSTGNKQHRNKSFLPLQQRIALASTTSSLHAVLTPATDFLGGAFSSFTQQQQQDQQKGSNNAVDQFFRAWNSRDFEALQNQFRNDCTFDDATYPGPFEGNDAINRHFRLLAASTEQTFVLDNMAVGSNTNTIAVLYHVEESDKVVPNSRRWRKLTLKTHHGVVSWEKCSNVLLGQHES
jgi:ketosteroid isomerase-like protein